MKRTTVNIITIALVFCFSSVTRGAVNIVECEDEHGNKVFSKSCPSGYSVIDEKNFSTAKGASKEELEEEELQVNIKNVSVSLYLVSEGCDACDEAKEYLSSLGVKLNIINVTDNLEQQNKLKELAGELRVPITVIGDNIIKGNNRAKLESVIKEVALQQQK